MADVQDLADSIFARLRPDSQINVQISLPQILTFINDAALDLRNSGWLIILNDDESLEFAVNDYDYDIPADFAFIHEIRVEDDTLTPSTWDEIVEFHLWRVTEDVAGTPELIFHTGFPIPDGKAIKVMGQKRPSLYTAITDTIDAGMESFIRESALASALSYMASARPDVEFERGRFALSQEARRRADRFLALQPMRFRPFPNSEYVPTR